MGDVGGEAAQPYPPGLSWTYLRVLRILEVGVLVIVVFTVAMQSRSTPAHTVVYVGVLGLWVCSYLPLVTVRWRLYSRRWTSLYLVTMSGCFGLLLWLEPNYIILLWVISPHIWFIAGDTVKEGLLWTTAVVGVALGVFFRAPWSDEETFLHFLPYAVFSLGASLLLGWWIAAMVRETNKQWELTQRLRATQDELDRAHHAAGVIAERTRMAGEIHDTLAQGFLSVVAHAQVARACVRDQPDVALDKLTVIEDTARQNLAEARALVAAWAPVDLADGGLASALGRVAERAGKEHGFRVDVTWDLDRDLDRDTQVLLLRAAQEGLTNVGKHAGARTTRVTIGADADDTVLVVADDGCGVGGQGETSGGYGIVTMRHRAQEMGGSVDLADGPDGGCVLVVRVPRVAATVAS